MTDKLKEAIEVLKSYNVVIDIGEVIQEAIDTVVVELEKTTYTAEDMEAFAEWCSESLYNYHKKHKVWMASGIYRKVSTAQLREIWEKERKEETE